MKFNKFITIGIILLLTGAFSIFLIMNLRTKTEEKMSEVQDNTTTQTSDTQTITFTNKGFEPTNTTAKKGTRIIWINNSNTTATVNSDDHPTHTKTPELNLADFEPGSSLQVVFTKVGVFNFHNHINPTQKGSIRIVE